MQDNIIRLFKLYQLSNLAEFLRCLVPERKTLCFLFGFIIAANILQCFFFQAEDGIRDLTVTGVQTCALPILRGEQSYMPVLSILDLAIVVQGATPADALRNTLDLAQHAERWGYRRYWLAEHRSEERRVGEEGRSRWSPYPLKKKKSDEVS